MQRLVKEIESKEPKGIHLLVNNAGIARDDNTKFSTAGQPEMKDAAVISAHFMKSDPQAWADTFATNVTAGFFMSVAFLPLLAKGTESTPGYASSVVNVSSISGAMKGTSNGQPAYASSKAAFTHLTRMLATTFAGVKVRVNCIAPGLFPSEMTAGTSGEDQKSKLDVKMSNPAGESTPSLHFPLFFSSFLLSYSSLAAKWSNERYLKLTTRRVKKGRPGHDSDMAATILLLAGRGGLFYNEQILYPDGGECPTRGH